jgi:non-ribosomal peptide synthetase component F
MPMTIAGAFWFDALRDCEIDRSLSLPFDRHRIFDEYRTGRGTSVSFNFSEEFSRAFLTYASASSIAPEHLALACYYVFLFKLTNGEKDLCVGMNTNGRYKAELYQVIGMFVNAIPLRCRVDPNGTFGRLIEHVRLMATRSCQYSYFPLQRILAQHNLTGIPSFLDVSFEFRSNPTESNNIQLICDHVSINAVPFSIKIDGDEVVNKFDFSLNILYDPNSGHISGRIDASLDVFDVATVNLITQRFLLMLMQLFEVSVDRTTQAMYDLSLILPEEVLLLESIKNPLLSFASLNCLHHEFIYHSPAQSQKVAVEIDAQSLTNSEILYYGQQCAMYLLKEYHVSQGEIICLCLERSLSMVSTIKESHFPYPIFRDCSGHW